MTPGVTPLPEHSTYSLFVSLGDRPQIPRAVGPKQYALHAALTRSTASQGGRGTDAGSVLASNAPASASGSHENSQGFACWQVGGGGGGGFPIVPPSATAPS